MLSGSNLNREAVTGLVNTDDLVRLFDDLFFPRFNTRLEGGGDEPIYLPAEVDGEYHRLIFRSDYVSSAFHEISHWCIAGESRRQLVDFGYWYNPDGRTTEQQRTFESVEIKPQALEWLFSVAAGHRFNISADNLSAEIGASDHFVEAVVSQVVAWCECPEHIPVRGAEWIGRLSEVYNTTPLNPGHYSVSAV